MISPSQRPRPLACENVMHIDRDQFAAILIGKDGGEKYRRYDVPELDGIFALIDGMPMRQDEMSQNPVDCSEQPQ